MTSSKSKLSQNWSKTPSSTKFDFRIWHLKFGTSKLAWICFCDPSLLFSRRSGFVLDFGFWLLCSSAKQTERKEWNDGFKTRNGGKIINRPRSGQGKTLHSENTEIIKYHWVPEKLVTTGPYKIITTKLAIFKTIWSQSYQTLFFFAFRFLLISLCVCYIWKKSINHKTT